MPPGVSKYGLTVLTANLFPNPNPSVIVFALQIRARKNGKEIVQAELSLKMDSCYFYTGDFIDVCHIAVYNQECTDTFYVISLFFFFTATYYSMFAV